MRINEGLLRLKQQILQYYKMYERWAIAMIKFLGASYSLNAINQSIGCIESLMSVYMTIGLAVICMILPVQYVLLIIMGVVTLHLMTFNLVVGVACMCVCICTYILFVRLYPKQSILIIVMMIALQFNLQYILPIGAGLFGGLSCIVPITLGVVFMTTAETIGVLMQNGGLSADMIENVSYIINLSVTSIVTNRTMLATIIIFTIVFLSVYIVRRQSIDYAAYIGIVIGSTMNLLGFLAGMLFLGIEVNVLIIIIMTIISAIIVVSMEYVMHAADYSRAETVRFEDEDHYYYVKVVPKIKISMSKTHIEQVYTNRDEEIETL